MNFDFVCKISSLRAMVYLTNEGSFGVAYHELDGSQVSMTVGSFENAVHHLKRFFSVKEKEREEFYEKLWKEFVSLQSGDAKGIIMECERLRLRVKKLTEAFKDANDLCRSAYQIASRDGKGTNWESFTKRVKDSLLRQSKALDEK